GITNPTATFEVGGGGALKVSGLSQFEGEVPGAGTNWNLGTFGDPKGTIYGFSRFGTVHLAIDVNSGNVGIGTTNPSHKLHSVNTSPSGAAVFGYATASSGTNYGVYGESSSLTGLGVFGKANSASGLNYGVFGQSNSTSGNGVYGLASATSGETFGMYGLNYSTMGRGVYGWAAAESGTNYGVYGTSSSTDGSGVYGIAIRSTGATNGVKGQSNSTTGRGVFGVAPTFGVAGYASATSGTNYGVFGETISPAGYGVYGNSNNVGVFGSGVTGVRGQATTGFFGVHGTSSSEGWGVYGVGGIGVRGETNSNVPSNNVGVYGLATPTSGFADGVWGVSNSTSGAGVFGNGNASSGTNYGVYGTTNSSSGYAGFFSGRVHVAGTLSKSGGQFKIDHPLDPANKYLNHSFVESPDMMNIYNGNITLDAGGEAWVILPEWFEALNKDFRYQLTGIGGFAPVYIAEEITGNRFKIAGGIAGMKISWQVTGIRKDAWAEKYRIPVEEEKKEDERGRYINPDAFGLSKEMGIPSIRLPILSERRGKGE
ncbi:MAG: hypothetical protein HY707_04040, partial [Ignavibacteriae bacterium]|nr:hypothetical protein [Ignavibacteriota bacterium]